MGIDRFFNPRRAEARVGEVLRVLQRVAVLECGDWSPLSAGDLSPSRVPGSCARVRQRAAAPGCADKSAQRQKLRQVAALQSKRAASAANAPPEFRDEPQKNNRLSAAGLVILRDIYDQ
jgi:hypothetical protein